MVTTVDERNGLVKVYWKDVRERVTKVEPQFAKIVDELSPGKDFPLYLAYFPYGALIGDTKSPFIPDGKGGYYRLSDTNAPKGVINDLGYGMNSAPFSMVLEKSFEFYVDLPQNEITIPYHLAHPGRIFPLTRFLNSLKNQIYAPNGVLNTVAGARSVFMLPNIGCMLNHVNLQKDFNIYEPPPKSLYGHWGIFKSLTESSVTSKDWQGCILNFSKPWIDHIHMDDSWRDLHAYLLKLGWRYTAYQRNAYYYDTIFSVIMNRRNLKPNPYLVDTARHLFKTACDEAVGYAPACNDDLLPANMLHKVFIESYGLNKYIPTIMQPQNIMFKSNMGAVYYSLQYPATSLFSPKARKISSTLFEMRELEHIVSIFKAELSGKRSMCSDTVVSQVARLVEFRYFHNKSDQHQVVHMSNMIPEFDNRFLYASGHLKSDDAVFADDGRFVRGCVSVQLQSNDKTDPH